jgi:hypothetical protein
MYMHDFPSIVTAISAKYVVVAGSNGGTGRLQSSTIATRTTESPSNPSMIFRKKKNREGRDEGGRRGSPLLDSRPRH